MRQVTKVSKSGTARQVHDCCSQTSCSEAGGLIHVAARTTLAAVREPVK